MESDNLPQIRAQLYLLHNQKALRAKLDQPQLAKAAHKGVDAWSRRADHGSQLFMGDALFNSDTRSSLATL